MEKIINIIDGDNQVLIKKVPASEREKEISKLEAKGFEDISVDVYGDIVFYRYL